MISNPFRSSDGPSFPFSSLFSSNVAKNTNSAQQTKKGQKNSNVAKKYAQQQQQAAPCNCNDCSLHEEGTSSQGRETQLSTSSAKPPVYPERRFAFHNHKSTCRHLSRRHSVIDLFLSNNSLHDETESNACFTNDSCVSFVDTDSEGTESDVEVLDDDASSSEQLSNQTTVRVDNHHREHPFQNIVSDCQHLIFFYYIQEMDSSIDCDKSSSNTIRSNQFHPKDEYSSPYDYTTWTRSEWSFVSQYVRCWHFHETETVKHLLRRAANHSKSCVPYYIDVSYNEQIDTETFELFHGVHELHISDTRDAHFDPVLSFKNLRGIHTLNVSFSSIEITDEVLEQLRGIRRLNISWNGGSKCTSKGFENLRGIEELRMSHTLFTECDANVVFESLRGIKTLDISSCTFGTNPTDDALKNLRGIHQLEMSRFVDHQFTRKGFQHLRGVKHLNLYQCSSLPADTLEELCGIEALNISDCPQFSDDHLKKLRGIRELDISYCSQYTDSALKNLRGIRVLKISRCIGIKGSGLENLRGIDTLYMDGNPQIPTSSFYNLRGVKRLDCSECPQIDDSVLAHLVGIEELHCRLCSQDTLTNAGFSYLSGITTLNVSQCRSRKMSAELLHHLKGIKSLSIDFSGIRIEEDDLKSLLPTLSNLTMLVSSAENYSNYKAKKAVRNWMISRGGYFC